jgi:hypothetical protein
MTATPAELKALVGHAFPGGRYRIAHWENFLLTEATGCAPMPEDLAHPAHLFHVPIVGAGTSIAQLFELGRAESDASITIDYYDWEYFVPLREDREYEVRGSITEHERTRPGGGPIVDALTFLFELFDPDGEPAARVTFRWYYWRWNP